jgi:hypothetical protein
VTGALVVLVLFGRARTRWAPVITLVPAVAWAAFHLSYVTKYVSLSQIGDVLRNLLTPGLASGGSAQSALVEVSKYSQAGAILVIGVLALTALVRDRSGLNLALLVCAASGLALILANSYGNEADFRAALFALPWLCILAGGFRPVSRLGSTLIWPLTVFVLLGTYLTTNTILDFVYAERPGDLLAVQTFENRAPAGSTLIVMGYKGNFPADLTSRYNLVSEDYYSNVRGLTNSGAYDAANSYRHFMSVLLTTHRFARAQSGGTPQRYYVLTAQQPAAYLAAYGYVSLEQYRAFSLQFASSNRWRLILHTKTAELYRLRSSQQNKKT